ncbi:MAG: 2TM domain-containing protein [Chloroflexi bacterium]|nr:2TM domain-containing protein [Chloroflexota bacterium]
MTENPIDYNQIRHRVEQRYDNLKGLIIHLAVYFFVIAAAWIMFGTSYILGIPIVLTLALLWGAGLVAHAVEALFDFVTARTRENAIRREIEMELYHREGRIPSFMEKPKRHGERLRLSDDGEIVTVDDDEYMADRQY